MAGPDFNPFARTSRLKKPHIPQFARGPNDAVQCYADLVQLNKRMEPYVGIDTRWEAGPYRSRIDFEEYVNETSKLPIFFWARQVASVVVQASQSYPLEREMHLPKLHRSFCVFEAPTLAARIDGEDTFFSALSWNLIRVQNGDGKILLRVNGFHWIGTTITPVWWMDIGSDLPFPDETYKSESDAILRWILTASMFVEQDIVSIPSTRPGKHFAKRIESVGHEASCHVVALRRRTPSGVSGEGERSVDWQCQWLVRGHWRRQFYPKANRNVPIFIEPYMKGPDDKPLKVPAPTVFAVTR